MREIFSWLGTVETAKDDGRVYAIVEQ